MARFVVLDVVFRGRSLNYDEGAGNYQSLKKITLEDGKTYTMVSRYALRYSLLQTMKRLFGDDVVLPGDKLTKETGGAGGERNKNVFQPDINILLSGEILLYPETDLFGFLITTKDGLSVPRESPVKITHAVSLTPYEGDAHLSGNHFIARRAYEAGIVNNFGPNLFVVEEHDTLYKYTIVIDTEQIGKLVYYISKGSEYEKKIEEKDKPVRVKKEEVGKDVIRVTVELPEDKKREHLKYFLESLLNLTREIKGSAQDISPRLLIVSLWDGNYTSLYDSIWLEQKYEEEYEEEEMKEENRTIVKRRVRLRSVPEIVVNVNGREVEERPWNVEDIVDTVFNGEKGKFYIFKKEEMEVAYR